MSATQVRNRWTWLTPAALAACAGAVDLLAFAGLGGAFAGVVTGNLVTAGLGIGTGDTSLIVPAATAIAGFAAGVAAWFWLWRTRPHALVGRLVAELVLLTTVAAGWIGTQAHPDHTVATGLLAVTSIAMGGQSVTALQLQVSTTYLTGTLTGALHDLVMGEPGRRAVALGQLLALTAGATTAAVLLLHQRWAVPILPIALLAVAIVMRTRH